jgi:hypothetical protein
MRLAILTCALVLVGASSNSVLGAEKGKPLDDAQCKAAWTIVSPNGAAISKGQPVPSIIDWTMVDTNKDAKIDADEYGDETQVACAVRSCRLGSGARGASASSL